MTDINSMKALLSANAIPIGNDGIYSSPIVEISYEQEEEKKLRESVAGLQYDNYLDAVAKSHSIPVMDKEVKRFLETMPYKARIIDIGGCWGWHWRNLALLRPDVEVLIFDFVRSNLNHAKAILAPLLGKQIFLMHGDATMLPFGQNGDTYSQFDGIWTVQVFQHIPNFEQACSEAFRVLKSGGKFVNYSLHITPINKNIYALFKKQYFIKGIFNNQYYLERANDSQKEIVKKIFGNVNDRYTECLFHPDLKIRSTAKEHSIIGKLDSYLSEFSWVNKLIARQRSFEATKQ